MHKTYPIVLVGFVMVAASNLMNCYQVQALQEHNKAMQKRIERLEAENNTQWNEMDTEIGMLMPPRLEGWKND